MKKFWRNAVSLGLTAALVVGLGSGINTKTAEADALAESKIDPTFYTGQRPYKAYLTFQDSMYNFRSNFDDSAFGVTATEEQKKCFTADESSLAYEAIYMPGSDVPGVANFDWRSMFFYRTAVGTETTKHEFRSLANNDIYDPDEYDIPENTKLVMTAANFVHPDVSYDGTYSVTMSDFPEDTFKYSHGFRMLCVNTTIPRSVTGVTFSNVSLTIDEGESSEKRYPITDAKIHNMIDSPNTYNLMVTNEYGYTDYGFSRQSLGSRDDAVPDPIWEAAKTNGGVINMPKKSIKITFTVSGLGPLPGAYDPSPTSSATPTVSPTSTASSPTLPQTPTDTTQPVTTFAPMTTVTPTATPTVKPGKQATPDVTTVAKKVKLNKKGTKVTVTKGGSSTIITLDTVLIQGKAYPIEAVGAKAYANKKKLETVTFKKSVKKIGKDAYLNCKKLRYITFESAKVPSIGKHAFKGIHKKAEIYVPKKAKNQYIKAFKKAGCYKKGMEFVGRK